MDFITEGEYHFIEMLFERVKEVYHRHSYREKTGEMWQAQPVSAFTSGPSHCSDLLPNMADYDAVLVKVAEYALSYRCKSKEALTTCRYALLDAIGTCSSFSLYLLLIDL